MFLYRHARLHGCTLALFWKAGWRLAGLVGADASWAVGRGVQSWAGFPLCGARAHVWYLAHQVPCCEGTDTRLFTLGRRPGVKFNLMGFACATLAAGGGSPTVAPGLWLKIWLAGTGAGIISRSVALQRHCCRSCTLGCACSVHYAPSCSPLADVELHERWGEGCRDVH